MKRLILASIFCVACALPAFAQDKLQLIPPEKLFEFPSLLKPDAARPRHTLDLRNRAAMPPSSLELTFTINPAQSGVCSVPLLEAHVDAVDPGIAVKPGNTAVPIPQAHVPAPACEKK